MDKYIIFKNGAQVITSNPILLSGTDLTSIISSHNHYINRINHVEVKYGDNEVSGKYITHDKNTCTIEVNGKKYVIPYATLAITNKEVVKFEANNIFSYLTKSISWICIANAFIHNDTIQLSFVAKIQTIDPLKGNVTLVSNNLNNEIEYKSKMALVRSHTSQMQFEHDFNDEISLIDLTSLNMFSVLSNVEKLYVIYINNNESKIEYKTKFDRSLPSSNVNIYENDRYISTSSISDIPSNVDIYLNGGITNKIKSHIRYTTHEEDKENVITITGNIIADDIEHVLLKYYVGHQKIDTSTLECTLNDDYVVYNVKSSDPVNIILKLNKINLE